MKLLFFCLYSLPAILWGQISPSPIFHTIPSTQAGNFPTKRTYQKNKSSELNLHLSENTLENNLLLNQLLDTIRTLPQDTIPPILSYLVTMDQQKNYQLLFLHEQEITQPPTRPSYESTNTTTQGDQKLISIQEIVTRHNPHYRNRIQCFDKGQYLILQFYSEYIGNTSQYNYWTYYIKKSAT
jgi:hypothetical protein